MIINLFLNIVVLFFGALFSWLPIVDRLPLIFSFDIDTAMVTGIGQLNVFMQTFWPLKYMFLGFLTIMTYYLLKIGVRFFLGHRAPGKS